MKNPQEKLAAIVGKENAEQYVSTVKAMIEADDFMNQEQVDEKIPAQYEV
jgi:hypothetical protein